MLIRNFTFALSQIKQMQEVLERECRVIEPIKLRYYKLQNAKNLYLTHHEEVVIILMRLLCVLGCR
jgi:hypothetical protein